MLAIGHADGLRVCPIQQISIRFSTQDRSIGVENSTKQQFQIYLPGLLKVLAENLYSSKKVAVRELLQNAHDSIVRRSVEGVDDRFKPRVEVWIDGKQRTLRIVDNGSGLTADDMTNYLSTIGRSYTRELSEKLAILSPEEAAKLIGQ